VTASHRVDYFVAISQHVARRIHKYYKRDSVIIYPPVESHRFQIADTTEDFYLIVSALTPYKRIDIAIEAFNQLGLPLVIIGDGPLARQLQAKAGKNITFLGWQPDPVLADYFSRCKAFLFCGEEDFGITVLEAHAAGRPVIAFRAGGALETVVEGETGMFFDQQNAASLIKAIEKCATLVYEPKKIRERALIFDRSQFKASIEKYVVATFEEHKQKDLSRVQTI